MGKNQYEGGKEYGDRYEKKKRELEMPY